ncbi:hypothetical protein L2728_21730, partial [Shewanella chilikensis]|uniref:hypothetical protein n=1 Tax=Shewanella chilikensis TaxID=558541 RepID=UPI00200ED16D
LSCRLASLCLLDELLNGVVHDVASDEPRITPLAYMIIRDATVTQYFCCRIYWSMGAKRHFWVATR